MAFLFIGGEDIDFSMGRWAPITDQSTFRPSFARCALSDSYPAPSGEGVNPLRAGFSAPSSNFYLGCRLYLDGGGLGSNGASLLAFYTGTTKLLSIRLNASNYIEIVSWGTPTTATILATSSSAILFGLMKLDVKVTYGVSGTVVVYMNNDPFVSYSGDVTVNGATAADGFAFFRPAIGQMAISECVVAERDTRTFSLKTHAPNGAGTVVVFPHKSQFADVSVYGRGSSATPLQVTDTPTGLTIRDVSGDTGGYKSVIRPIPSTPSASVPFEFASKVTYTAGSSQYNIEGLCLVDANNNIQLWGVNGGNSGREGNGNASYSNANGWSDGDYTVGSSADGNYFRIVCDGTTLKFYRSTDGVTWGSPKLNYNVSDHGVGMPTRYGFFTHKYSSGDADILSVSESYSTEFPKGSAAGWTGTYTEIDEIKANEADVIYTSQAEQLFSTQIDDAPSGNYTVRAFKVSGYGARGDTGPQNVQLGVYSGGTDAYGASHPLDTGWTRVNEVFETNPVTGAPWDTATITNLEIRLKSKS